MTANKIGFIKRINWLRLLKRHAWVIAVFLFMSFLFMGKSFTSCQNTVIGDTSGGDHVAGIIWLFTFADAPYGGMSAVTNFPFGESVSQPQLITSVLYLVPTWALSKLFGAICAWNLMVLFGYMSSALLMYGFVYWLLRRRGIALFAGLAVGFTPYHYVKTFGHLSYVQSGIFVLLMWVFLAFWRRPTRNKALLLGAVTALLFYSDGYFPFIGSVMLGSMLFYGLTADLISRRRGQQTHLKTKLRYLSLTALTVTLLLLPIAYAKVKYADRIQASLTGSRGNVMDELERYGAKPADYLLPSTDSPVPPLREAAQDYRAQYPHSLKGENSLYLGFTVMGLAAYATYCAVRRQKPAVLTKHSSVIWVVGACLSVGLAAGLLSLVPHLRIGDISITMPSELLGNVTHFWRVPARLYMAVNIAVVTVASIGLWLLTRQARRPWQQISIIVLAIIILVIELAPVNPLSRNDEWSSSKTSATYQWLRDQNSVGAVAAYPLLPSPFNSSYFGDQVVHKKPLLNSYLSSDKELYLHRALSGLSNGQTLGVLKALGIDHVLLYGIDERSQPNGLNHLYGTRVARVSAIDGSVRPLTSALIPLDGFNPPDVDPKTQIGCHKALDLNANMTVRNLTKSPPRDNLRVGFTLKGQPGQAIILYSGGEILAQYYFNSKNELKKAALVLDDDQVLSIYHISDRSKDYVSVCDLAISN